MRQKFLDTFFTPAQIKNHEIRLGAVYDALKGENASSVMDVGCGDGQLLELLAKDSQFSRLIGVDPSDEHLKVARKHAYHDNVEFRRCSLFELQKENSGTDAIVLMEVIEHLPETRLPEAETIIFGKLQPRLVIITTPRAAPRYSPEKMREIGHSFEWDEEEFNTWCQKILSEYGYSFHVNILSGPTFKRGTQVGIFKKNNR
jgi:cyclopropane fatty-acyl-phospholipid synthase-like methyltransferase